MKCCFCGTELLGNMTTPYCPNPNCKYWSFPMSSEIWESLISGKKAQDALKKYSLALSVAEEFIGSLPDYPNYSPQPVLDEIASITTVKCE